MLHSSIWPSTPQFNVSSILSDSTMCSDSFYFCTSLRATLSSKPKSILDHCQSLLTAFFTDYLIHSLLEVILKNVIYIMPVNFLKSCNSFPLDFEYNPEFLDVTQQPSPNVFLNFISGGFPFLSGLQQQHSLLLPRTWPVLIQLEVLPGYSFSLPEIFFQVLICFLFTFQTNLNNPVMFISLPYFLDSLVAFVFLSFNIIYYCSFQFQVCFVNVVF